MVEIELGLTDDEIKDKMRSIAIPNNVIDVLFYKDKKTNFLLLVGVCLLFIGMLILKIIT